MKRTLTMVCAALAFTWVGVAGAQSDQYGGSQSGSSKADRHAKSDKEVTLTGCLEQGTKPDVYVLRNATEESGGMSSNMSSGSMSGSSSTTGTSGQSTSGTSGEQTGTSGQSSMSQSQQSNMDFQLVGKSKDLKKYVGQRVEVRGVVEPMKEKENRSDMSRPGTEGTSGTSTSGQSGTQSGGSTSGETMSGGSMGNQTSAGTLTHRVKVKSVKQLSSSCQ